MMRKKTRNSVYIMMAGLILLLIVLGLFLGRHKSVPYDDFLQNKASVVGIDISSYTGKVDFQKAAEDHVRFVYMRATMGDFKVDSLLETNFVAARKQPGMSVGFYHFLRFDVDGQKQADFFYQHIKDKYYDLMPVVDVEDYKNHTDKSTLDRIKVIASFIQRLESLSGNRVMIYTNMDGYRKYVNGHFDDQPLWICNLHEHENENMPEYLFWQKRHNMRKPWADGFVDYNIFNGMDNDFAFLTCSKSVINHRSEVLNKQNINMICEEADGLRIYYPQYKAVDLACRNMPQASDQSVVFCAEAAFTGELQQVFHHTNIAGNHVSGGHFFKGYKCKANTGCFTWYPGKATFVMGDGAGELQQAAKMNGMGFGQVMIIHQSEVLPLWRSNSNYYRALCMKNGQLCIIDSQEDIPYKDFVQYLKEYDVQEAIYLDMGVGWNHSWYRDNDGVDRILFPKVIDYTTNWIVFKK